MADDIRFKKIKGGWARLVLAKMRVILANDIPSKKREGEWVGLVLVNVRQMFSRYLTVSTHSSITFSVFIPKNILPPAKKF